MMAKRKLGEVKANTPVGKAMAAIFPIKIKEILAQEDAVRASDVDGVHDMRVATKRLREAARLFRPAFGRKRMSAHVEHLQTLNDSLGAVRELDVLGLQLLALGARVDGLLTGLQPLIHAKADSRSRAHNALLPVLDDTLEFLDGDFESLLHERSKKRKGIWKMPFSRLACDAMSKRLQRAFALEQSARAPEAVHEFHRMRIAIKKVKYAFELFRAALPKRVKKAYKLIAALQELMGEVHDCDVLISVLASQDGETIAATLTDGATEIVAADRARLHAESMALLDSMHSAKLVEKLLGSLC